MEKDDLVTLNELFNIIKPYCEKKIQRDNDKGNPLEESIDELVYLLSWEFEELKDIKLLDNIADIDEVYLNEIADCINYLLFIAGKVKNYKIFLRG